MKNRLPTQQDLIREDIASKVRDFWHHQKVEDFVPGLTPVPVTGKKIFADDIVKTVDSVLDAWFTGSENEEKLERSLSRFVGMRGGGLLSIQGPRRTS